MSLQDGVAKGPAMRDARIDSATGVLIILVVFGHTLATMDGGAAHAAVFWLYSFHMPAFVFVSGYVTRLARSRGTVSIITRMLFPYLVFAVVQHVLDSLIAGTPFSFNPLSVPWTLWYLLALMVWRLVAPLASRLPFAPAVIAATVLSIVGAGVSWIGPDFSIGRIVGYLPFFVAGLLWHDEWWQWLRSRRVTFAAAAILLGWALWALPFHRIIPRAEFFFSQAYEDLELGPGEGMIHRAVILAVAGVLALSAISLVWRALPIAPSIGVASLAVYLLHAIVLLPWHVRGAPSWFSGSWAVLCALVLSAALAWFLSRKPVVAATRPLMDLRWWQERGRALRAARSRP